MKSQRSRSQDQLFSTNRHNTLTDGLSYELETRWEYSPYAVHRVTYFEDQYVKINRK